MERWSGGVMEWWSDGVMELRLFVVAGGPEGAVDDELVDGGVAHGAHVVSEGAVKDAAFSVGQRKGERLDHVGLLLEKLVVPGNPDVGRAMLHIDGHVGVLDEDPLQSVPFEHEPARCEIRLVRHRKTSTSPPKPILAPSCRRTSSRSAVEVVAPLAMSTAIRAPESEPADGRILCADLRDRRPTA